MRAVAFIALCLAAPASGALVRVDLEARAPVAAEQARDGLALVLRAQRDGVLPSARVVDVAPVVWARVPPTGLGAAGRAATPAAAGAGAAGGAAHDSQAVEEHNGAVEEGVGRGNPLPPLPRPQRALLGRAKGALEKAARSIL